jgi:hypothetical protein
MEHFTYISPFTLYWAGSQMKFRKFLKYFESSNWEYTYTRMSWWLLEHKIPTGLLANQWKPVQNLNLLALFVVESYRGGRLRDGPTLFLFLPNDWARYCKCMPMAGSHTYQRDEEVGWRRQWQTSVIVETISTGITQLWWNELHLIELNFVCSWLKTGMVREQRQVRFKDNGSINVRGL